MSGLLIRIWGALFLIPAVPVIAFYLLFSDQNYFELKDTARGIVATGPIAAYVALIAIGWTIYKRVSNLTTEVSPLLPKFLGTWNYVATSNRGTERQGSAEITEDHGEVCVSGNFEDKGKTAGEWSSEMARVVREQLKVVYRLEDFRPEGRRSSTALLSVRLNPKEIDTMSGNWVVLGGDSYGDIVFTRSKG